MQKRKQFEHNALRAGKTAKCKDKYSKYLAQGCKCKWRCDKKAFFVQKKNAGKSSGGLLGHTQSLCCPKKFKQLPEAELARGKLLEEKEKTNTRTHAEEQHASVNVNRNAYCNIEI